MLNPYEKATVICPFYCGDNQNIVTCEGVSPDNIILLFGRNVETYCQSDWRKCQIARMNWARYDDLSSLKNMDPEHQKLYDQNNLSKRQMQFCCEYINCRNATRAYMTAYPSVKNSASAASNACKLLKKPTVKAYLESQGIH